MRNLVYICLTSICILFASCGDDETSSVEVNFRLVNGGEPIAAFDRFEYPLGYNIFLTKFSFFISDLTLSRADGEQQVILDYGWVDLLTDQIDPATALEGSSITIADIPAGDYTQLQINLGIDEATNAMSPADFATNHPLGNTGEYWEGWSSYIFNKIEGKIDSDDDGEFEKNVALHIGSNDAFRTKLEARNISISADGNNTISFVIDLQDVMTVEGATFDINAMPQVHSEMALPRVLPLMDNLIEEF